MRNKTFTQFSQKSNAQINDCNVKITLKTEMNNASKLLFNNISSATM